MDKTATNIIEIFSSAQGEGIYLGCKQIFMRLSGCNLDCKYCDTCTEPREYCRMFTDGFIELKNPVSPDKFIETIRELNKEPHHSLSITGGEPLLNIEFFKELLPKVRVNFPDLKIYLETNGTLPDEMKEIAELVDITAMDVKPESATGQPMLFEEHKEFIKVLKESGREFFVKVIFGENLLEEDIKLIKTLVDKDIILVLQPITEQNVSQDKLFEVQNNFLQDIKDVRIIPQMHKYMGLR